MPNDSQPLRDALFACLPSLVIDDVASPSGQRVVYFGHFEDKLIPPDIPPPEEGETALLHGWEQWGRVVIKVVGNASPEALTRLQAETAILTELRPENFPALRYCNLFTENPLTEEPLPERLYVSIEDFVVSQTLRNCMNDYHSKPGPAIDICIKICNALLPIWTHPKRFVHRDIKPENILIKPNGDVVIIDLGIVRETGGAGITKEGWGNAPLTLDYASPEQIANDKDAISFKSDFFALGVLLYQLISGSHPFRKSDWDNPFELADSIERQEPASLASIGAASEPISETVQWLMAKKPFMRPRTPALLIDKLKLIRDQA